MIVYRISRTKYASDLSGKGAEIFGGRWNNIRTALFYASSNRALCLLELLVHLPIGVVPDSHSLTTIEIPDSAPILKLYDSELPPDWKNIPPTDTTQNIGDRFVSERNFLGLKIPSIIIGDCNIILNPRHPEFSKVKIVSVEPIDFDQRLINLLGRES